MKLAEAQALSKQIIDMLPDKFYFVAGGILFVVFVVLFGKGFERLVYGGKLYGAVMMALGWLLGVASLWIMMLAFLGHCLLCAENTDVSSVSGGASATCYRGAEHIGHFPLVIAELKFGHVERQILGADLVEGAHDAAFDQRPEAVDCLRVDGTEHVFTERVLDGKVGIFHRQAAVDNTISRMLSCLSASWIKYFASAIADIRGSECSRTCG